MSDTNEPTYELVMPFVVCKSAGGPFDDGAFTAGYEMGLLDNELAVLDIYKCGTIERTVRTANLPQVDLIAMRRGWIIRARLEWPDGEWTQVVLEQRDEDDVAEST